MAVDDEPDNLADLYRAGGRRHDPTESSPAHQGPYDPTDPSPQVDPNGPYHPVPAERGPVSQMSPTPLHAQLMPPQMPPAMHARPAPPPIPVPFGPADAIQLSKLKAGLAETQKQVNDSTLHPQEGAVLQQGLMAQIGPLMQRQQQAKDHAMQQQQQELMKQSAMMEAIQQQHATSQAQTFHQTVASFTDPMTGHTAHFYQTKRGDWKEVEFSKHRNDQDRDAHIATS